MIAHQLFPHQAFYWISSSLKLISSLAADVCSVRPVHNFDKMNGLHDGLRKR